MAGAEGTYRRNLDGTTDFIDADGRVFSDVHLSPRSQGSTAFIYGDPPQSIPRSVDNPTQAQRDGALEYGLDPRWIDENGGIRWVDKPGTIGPEEVFDLAPGTAIDRYGVPRSPFGRFFSPAGEPRTGRAIPPSNDVHYAYDVVAPHPLPVHQGTVKPWFDDVGGGTQYRFDTELIERRYGPNGDSPVDAEVFEQMISNGQVNFEYWFGFTG